MGIVLFVVVGLLSALEAQAITWDFNEDSQGWVALDWSGSNVLPILNSEVNDGVWRAQVAPY